MFFDYTCPYAYLATTQAPALAKRIGAELVYRPILLGGVFKARGTPQNLSNVLSPSKAAHNLADMQRWAKRYDKPLRMPAAHPMRSVEALRATLASGIDPDVITRFFAAYWDRNEDIGKPEVIEACLGKPVPDLEPFKDDLRKRTDDAVARGVFGVPTWAYEGELYWGQDRMVLVENAPLLDPEVGRKEIEFFWDFSSPFAYLASTQIDRMAAKTGTKIVHSPILVGGLFKALGGPVVPLAEFSPEKQKHVGLDMNRWAKRWGVDFVFPSRFPINSVNALRVWYALPEEKRDAFRHAVFRAYWAEDRDIADPAVLAEFADADAIAKSKTDEVKLQVRAATERAQAKGAFGVPTMIAENELYWGQDRLEMAFTSPAAERS